MDFHILTLFPDFFSSPFQSSILKKAAEKKIIDYSAVNIRDFSDNKHLSVDAKVFGGGAGMLMQPEPIALAIESVIKKYSNTHKNSGDTPDDIEVIYFSPSGQTLTQDLSYELAHNGKHKIFLCGHYEGVDERVLKSHVDRVISVGETVVTGGEIPALFCLDSVVRLLPGAISKESSHKEESFSFDLYGKGEFPQYTRPAEWRGKKVPEVLLSGHEKKIEGYRRAHIKNCSPIEQKIIELRNILFSVEKPYKTRNLLFRIAQKSDIYTWLTWFTDAEICQYTMSTPDQTLADEERFFQWQHYNLHLLNLQILDKKTMQHVGCISLEIAPQNNSASLGIVIGEKKKWNTGIASESVQEIVYIAKKFLGLSKITLDVFTENIAAQKVYEKCGFRQIGMVKNHVCKKNIWFDCYLYELCL